MEKRMLKFKRKCLLVSYFAKVKKIMEIRKPTNSNHRGIWDSFFDNPHLQVTKDFQIK